MKRGLGLSNKQIGDVFATWNKGVLDSFLIEITRDIMYFNDDDGTPLVEKILDKAGQKGTGKWTAVNALDLGMPVTLIAEAVLSRCLSAVKDQRTKAASKLEFVSRTKTFEGNQDQFLDDLEQGLYASKIISYAQGFMLMQEVRFRSLYIPIESVTWFLTKSCLSVGCQGVQLEAQQARDCPHVARWVHHPLRLPQGHHQRLPQQPRPGEPSLRRLLQQGHPQGAAWLERRRLQGRPPRYPYPGLLDCPVMVRRLQDQGSACQPAPGPA
jgi:hypothetical protein